MVNVGLAFPPVGKKFDPTIIQCEPFVRRSSLFVHTQPLLLIHGTHYGLRLATIMSKFSQDDGVPDTLHDTIGTLGRAICSQPYFNAEAFRLKAELTDFGRLAVVGYVDGQMLTGLDLEPVHGKRLQIFGLSNAPLSTAMRAVAQRGFEREVMPAIIDGRIVPVIDRTFPFDELPAAKQYVEENTLLGKVAIRFG